MDEIVNSVKMVFDALTGFGWLPVPLFVACITMFALRIAYEPDVLAVSTPADVAALGKVKLAIFLAVAFVAGLIQYGTQKPANGFERALALGFTLGDTMFAYVVTSSQKVKGLVKSQFSKGGPDAAPPAP